MGEKEKPSGLATQRKQRRSVYIGNFVTIKNDQAQIVGPDDPECGMSKDFAPSTAKIINLPKRNRQKTECRVAGCDYPTKLICMLRATQNDASRQALRDQDYDSDLDLGEE